MSSIGNLDKEIELELLEIKEENPNFSIFLETYKQYNDFLGKQIDPFKAEQCVHDMLALDLKDHQPLLDAMTSNWNENMSVQDWIDHFNSEYKIIKFLLNFEEVLEVLRFKIKPNIKHQHRKSNRNKTKAQKN